MAEIWGVHGVPMALQRDGWWLDDDPALPPTATRLDKRPLALLVMLILLADVLFWGHSLGLSLALFAMAVFAASLTRRPGALPVVVLLLGVLPVLDHVQALSVAFLILGLIAAVTIARLGPATPDVTLGAILSVTRSLPWRGLRDALTATRHLRPDLRASGGVSQTLRAWAFPLGGGLVLLSLLAQANPILDGWLIALVNAPFDPAKWVRRALFWAGIALMVWPLLTNHPAAAHRAPHAPKTLTLGLNAASVSNALILFNALLALQTLLDARYLWSGATLPPGMTLAEYAHRGAYPLLATALLAGAFALAARPFLTDRRILKPLLILWLAQNILLTLSALYRLDLYVQSFGLTYLRTHALIWMALVAAGLALTLAQIAAGRSNLWLLIRCTLMGAATLYACCFINFADLIARTNVAMGKIDPLYLCQLGPTAAASLPPIAWRVEEGISYDSNFHYCTLTPPAPQTWRNWGFRNWLVLRNLARQEAAHEDPRRG